MRNKKKDWFRDKLDTLIHSLIVVTILCVASLTAPTFMTAGQQQGQREIEQLAEAGEQWLEEADF